MAGRYDRPFFDSIMPGSRMAADRVFEAIEALFTVVPASMVDVGCGTGAWCKAFSDRFATDDIRGIDGPYVDTEQLLFGRQRFVAHDLTQPVSPDRRFGLAVSLEVGEHLPSDAAPTLVSTLVGHSDHVLFSAAVPGQGGEYHLNEQPLEYWRDLFRNEGYVAVDCVRPRVYRDMAVEPWYRYNTILYVRAAEVASLPPALRACVVADGEPLRNFASATWRLRCRMISLLPARAVLAMARCKRRMLVPVRSRLAPT